MQSWGKMFSAMLVDILWQQRGNGFVLQQQRGCGFVLQAGKDNRGIRMGNGGCHDHDRETFYEKSAAATTSTIGIFYFILHCIGFIFPGFVFMVLNQT